MPTWALALIVKPFFLVVFFTVVYGLVGVVGRLLPPGPVKTFLFRRRG